MNIKFEKNIIIKLYFFMAPFAVSALFQNIIPTIPLSTVIIFITFLCLIYYLSINRRIQTSKFDGFLLLLIISPIILSIFGIFFAFLFQNDVFYFSYINENLISRFILIVCNITILAAFLTLTYRWNQTKVLTLIKYYYYGLFILVVIGLWQFLHFIFGIPFINIETRNHIHSVGSSSFFINKRLTSLANEPSYLTPFLIDYIILTFLFCKKNIKFFVFVGFFVLIFSYSGGGYLDLVFLLLSVLIGYFKYKNYRFKTKHIIITFILFLIGVVILVLFQNEFYYILYPVLGRLNTIFDMQKHSRMYMIFMPFVWVLDGSLVNVLVGYGPSSYNYLNLTKMLPMGGPVHATSNNLFSDIVFELGYIGFLSYVYGFLKVIRIAFSKIYNNKYYYMTFVLTIHLVVSSIYRADYMQSRFWILLFILLKLLYMGEMNEKKGKIA